MNFNQLQLVAKIQEGDAGAFTDLFKNFQPDMFRFLWHLTRSEEVSHDLIQDVFLKIWRNHKTWNPKSNLKAYLFRAAKNAALNYLEQDKTNLQRFESLTETLQGDTIPDKDYEKKERHLFIEQAVDSLPKGCRTVFILSRYEGLRYQEIAKVLGISVKTVENHMRRALILLREKLGEVLKDQVLKKFSYVEDADHHNTLPARLELRYRTLNERGIKFTFQPPDSRDYKISLSPETN